MANNPYHRTHPSNINPVGHLFSVAAYASGANNWSPLPSSLQTKTGLGWVGEYSERDVIIDQGCGVPNCEQINGQQSKRQITVSHGQHHASKKTRELGSHLLYKAVHANQVFVRLPFRAFPQAQRPAIDCTPWPGSLSPAPGHHNLHVGHR